jgi:hypothetical protein
VIAVDISEAAIDQLNKRDTSDNPKFICGDFTNLDLAENFGTVSYYHSIYRFISDN